VFVINNITFIFFGESIILGIISGVLGYIAGISSYTLFSAFGVQIGVFPKLEVGWSILTLFLQP